MPSDQQRNVAASSSARRPMHPTSGGARLLPIIRAPFNTRLDNHRYNGYARPHALALCFVFSRAQCRLCKIRKNANIKRAICSSRVQIAPFASVASRPIATEYQYESAIYYYLPFARILFLLVIRFCGKKKLINRAPSENITNIKSRVRIAKRERSARPRAGMPRSAALCHCRRRSLAIRLSLYLLRRRIKSTAHISLFAINFSLCGSQKH